MINKIHKYSFNESIPVQELEDTFMLALIAVEILHGRYRVQEECKILMDKSNRTYVIDASTDAGNDLNLLFNGFAIKEYGEHSVKVERLVCKNKATQMRQ